MCPPMSQRFSLQLNDVILEFLCQAWLNSFTDQFERHGICAPFLLCMAPMADLEWCSNGGLLLLAKSRLFEAVWRLK